MNINYGRRLLYSFIRVFTVLFVILVVMPWILEQILHYISGGMPPDNDSIKVFKDFVVNKAVMSRFINTLKKVIIFM